MDKCTGLTKNTTGEFVHGPARENWEKFIFRPQRNRRDSSGHRKHVLVSDWDPWNPDIAKILQDNKDTLYCDPINRKLFPDGSVIAGFLRRRNIGEMVASTTPQKVPRPNTRAPGGSGCGPCDVTRCQIHNNLVTTNSVISPWDGRSRKITKSLTCKSPNLVYYLKCTWCPIGLGLTPHYVGSSVVFRASRWSSHNNCMLRGDGKECSFCEHWAL